MTGRGAICRPHGYWETIVFSLFYKIIYQLSVSRQLNIKLKLQNTKQTVFGCMKRVKTYVRNKYDWVVIACIHKDTKNVDINAIFDDLNAIDLQ